MNNSLLSEASESELLETYTKTVTKTNALQVSLMKEEEIIRQLLNDANMAETATPRLSELASFFHLLILDVCFSY